MNWNSISKSTFFLTFSIACLIVSQFVFAAPAINSVIISPSEFSPGVEFTITVDASDDVTRGMVIVDFRPFAPSITRATLSFDDDSGLWIASGAVPDRPLSQDRGTPEVTLRILLLDATNERIEQILQISFQQPLDPVITVPNVIGDVQAMASTKITAEGFVVGTITSVNSAVGPAGQVLQQTPAAGTPASPSDSVDLVISLGPKNVIVPGVVGLSQSNAVTTLINAGLQPGTMTKVNSEFVAPGDIIRQIPVDGTTLLFGSAVNLEVSIGPAQVVVPDVTGLSQSEAEHALTLVGLSVGTITTQNDDVTPIGNILSQLPLSGLSVATGSSVDLVISLGEVREPISLIKVCSSVFADEDGVYATGKMVRIDVESSSELDFISGAIRIRSASQVYDSGIQDLMFSPLFFHWDTTGLNPADDYIVEIELTTSDSKKIVDDSNVITLVANPPAINKLVSDVDISFPALGLPVRIVRTYLLDSTFDGPLGFGWTHTYLMHVVATADGLVKVFNADGSGSFFQPNGDGTFKPSRDDFRTLTKNSDGTFQLREKFGTVFHFNDSGRLVRVVDRNGNTLILEYNDDGLLDNIIDRSNQRTTFAYHENNLLSSITDPSGRSVFYGYDDDGNLTSFVNLGGFETIFDYDVNNNLSTMTDPEGRSTFFTINKDDLLESIEGKDSDNKLTYEYGKPTSNQITITDALGNQTITTFDNNALITKITDSLGNSTIFSYDSGFNLISLTDANGGVSTRTYDIMGNIVSLSDAEGNIIHMEYDPVFSLITSFTDSTGNLTTFDYNTNGDLIAITYPDSTTETFTYNTSGEIATKTDRMNQTIKFAYDFRGLLTKKNFPDNSTDMFFYDLRGNLISASDENGSIDFTYDSLDRLMEVNYPGGESIFYAYDTTNNRTQISYPDGLVLDYKYDDSSRLKQISESSQIIATYTYDQLGRIIRRHLGNGNSSTFTYDQSGRLLSLINSKSTAEIISSFNYTYDNVGNRLTMTTLEGTTQYFYDAINQLTQVVLPDGSPITYSFDSSGNRNTVGLDGDITRYTTNSLNQYTDVGGDTYTYDANGNLSSKTTAQGQTTYRYDFENRLIQVDTPAETITYSYDPFGRRISKTTSCCATNYIYDDKRIIMETDESGVVLATYIHGIFIDEILVMNREGVDYYYMQDGLGSITDLSDVSENVIESFSYDAYGLPSNLSIVGNPYLFTGREFEAETDMYFYRARYYDPEIGRFITTDPIGFAGGNNLYSYVSNNPVNSVDPTGLSSTCPHCPALECGRARFGCVIVCYFDILNLPFGPCQTCLKEVEKRCNRNVSRGDPTFIQPSERHIKRRNINYSVEHKGLVAIISIPGEDSLVRGNVPIFGLAYGQNFQQYEVEYGIGPEPTEWITIGSSTASQNQDATPLEFENTQDETIYGNLVTWDTGLKNYSYMPVFPKDHPINLKGTYTVRLVVTGTDGSTVEDRVTVHVANVIPNAWGGKAISNDGQTVLEVKEQALMESFRLILIQSVDKAKVAQPSARQLVSNVYEIREPGEKFIKPAVLRMKVRDELYHKIQMDHVGIYAYDQEIKKWKYLESSRREGKGMVFTKIRELHPYYALMASDIVGEGSSLEVPIRKNSILQAADPKSEIGHYLVNNTFENGFGEWSSRDGEVGARVSLDNTVTFDGTNCLKIINTNKGGNFAVTVHATPYDIREFPLVQFDYRISSDVKTNLLVKVAGRWYDVGLTDDYKELKHKRVNIAHIGQIDGIIANDQWQSVQFNLYDILRSKTGNTVVEEMIMADWDVPGFMKLAFGNNSKGATYYIDNFTISRDPRVKLGQPDEILVVDDFNKKKSVNALGNTTTIFTASDGEHIEVSFSTDDVDGKGHALELAYDVSAEGSYGGYMSSLHGIDPIEFQILKIAVKGLESGQDMWIGLKDQEGNEDKILASTYLPGGLTMDWQELEVPLCAFTSLNKHGRPDNLSFSFSNSLHTAGTILIDGIEFRRTTEVLKVDDFEDEKNSNLLGGHDVTRFSGEASIIARKMRDGNNGIYSLSYGGNIGEPTDYESGLSYASWLTELRGNDYSHFQFLSFRIRGADGGEAPNIYLSDGNFRWSVALKDFAALKTTWQTVNIPLAEFKEAGVDLSHLEELQISFEWERMSGTIYIDDIQFQKSLSDVGLAGNKQIKTPLTKMVDR